MVLLQLAYLRRIVFALAFWTSLALLVPAVDAHIAAWHKGMYCLNGTDPHVANQNANEAVNPLYMLDRRDWWMHHVNKCDEFPPAPGDFLELPAGKSFVVELAGNRAFTSLSYNGRYTGVFGDGKPRPGMDGGRSKEGCITNPNLHTKSEKEATGTAFAISYHSNLADVKPENLVVFSVLYHQVLIFASQYTMEADCQWGWVPDGCGEPNMYMQPLKCKVVGHTGNRAVAPAKPPVFCELDQSKCVKGAKQMVFWNQLNGNNIVTPGSRAPTYNQRLGFANGRQTDIFLQEGTAPTTYIPPGPSVTPTDHSDVREESDADSAPRSLDALVPLKTLAVPLLIFIASVYLGVWNA
ncbi:hypothetical protein CC1G_00550 [Coprinopsis cinerea okayama7|uniref:Uncharacterized protein n=1 Tax=Coprinopsis cinerea (strain Okayama-7 / 130 / ATCC MYA-4618 / FGSC 9003) TaxID=240176 RepID=A8N3C6_COPC7|nr:hypothetical protein CC1G_00550 [Coprinopsis cinerea okayama7\|eukprot:XP_001829371.2 hypothetical protein CC1G_00550 [Coprinopsis cinerea okayama7\